ncbi:MAG: fused response regulator/phosphatase [Nitrosomonadales bacterium]|nr:fused response regulator/phosphatase [Nitrosomonadales bacterium]
MSESFQQSISILVIEDDPGDFGLIRAHVRLSGLVHGGGEGPVVWAKTLAEGIAAARGNKPDVVLLDLSLPDSAGLDTVRAMRAALHDVPIVILTGHDDSALDAAALEVGAQDYLVKGQFEHNALGRAVRHALVRGALEQELERKNRELLALHESEMDDMLVASDIMGHIMRSDGLRDPQVRYFQRPTQQFGGDFIAAARDNNGDLRVMLADVTGHGLQAALFLLPIFRIFQTMVKKGLQTCDIVAEINRTMRELAVTGRFIAAAVTHIARDGSSIEIWNGGIPTAFHVQKNGGLHKFRSRHLPLGVVDADAFEATTEIFHAQPGALLLCSDGLTEAENASGEPFGEARFESLLQTSPPDELFDDILSALETHLGGGIARDDLSIVLAQCGV